MYCKNRISGTSSNFPSSARDQLPGIFRSIGRFLYSKRQETANTDRSQDLPALNFDPEEVADQSGLSHDDFVGYLHENAINLYANCDTKCLDRIVNILHDISKADLMIKVDTRLFENRRPIAAMGSSIAGR